LTAPAERELIVELVRAMVIAALDATRQIVTDGSRPPLACRS
jgi:hypothetical protein